MKMKAQHDPPATKQEAVVSACVGEKEERGKDEAQCNVADVAVDVKSMQDGLFCVAAAERSEADE